jgi:hypothetical protein
MEDRLREIEFLQKNSFQFIVLAIIPKFSTCLSNENNVNNAASMQQEYNDYIFKNKIFAFLDAKLNVFEPHISKKLSLF